MDNLKPPEALDRSVSNESDGSHYEDAHSDVTASDDGDSDEEYELSDITDDDHLDDPTGYMHPFLYEDMENLILIYGEKSLEYRVFESIDQIDVELHIPLLFLEEVIAQAWGVNRNEPLVVRLHLSLSAYIEGNFVPKIEVFQASKKEGFGFGSQVRKFTEMFLDENWRKLADEYKACKFPETIKKSQTFPVTVVTQVKEEKPGRVNDEDIAKLVETGFDAVMARNALIITHGNVEDALNLILNNPATCYEDPRGVNAMMEQTKQNPDNSTAAGTSEDSNTGQASAGGNIDCANDDAKSVENPIETGTDKPKGQKFTRQYSHPPPLISRLKKMLPKLTRTTSVTPNIHRHIEDLNLMPLTTLDGKHAKNVPSLHDGFLVQIFRYIRQRIPTLNEYCVICDQQHVFQNGAMLKPAVCSRDLCVFAFQTLGVMADAAEDISTGAEVVDLLINMTRAACKSHRKELIFDPYPTVVHPKFSKELLFNPDKKQYKEVEKVLEDIPSMMEMSSMSTELKQDLDNKNYAVYPLIQWIITSNRSHIVKLSQERQLKFMVTPHQFLLQSSPPAKEIAFQEAKRQHGSTFAFHGSAIENWHCIIRHGLKNASGTKLQVNGAAYGNGIYLSPYVSTSQGYSRMGYSSYNVKKGQGKSFKDPRFLNSNNITCIAICEVITSNKLNRKNSSIWVCSEPDHVCTRFFFVYEDGQVGETNIYTQDKKYLDQIYAACYSS